MMNFERKGPRVWVVSDMAWSEEWKNWTESAWINEAQIASSVPLYGRLEWTIKQISREFNSRGLKQRHNHANILSLSDNEAMGGGLWEVVAHASPHSNAQLTGLAE